MVIGTLIICIGGIVAIYGASKNVGERSDTIGIGLSIAAMGAIFIWIMSGG